jgi:hypothetical protein
MPLPLSKQKPPRKHRRTNKLLDYLETHPDATIIYHASDMILHIHSDASKKYNLCMYIVFNELKNVLSTEQCRYTVPTKNRNLPTTIQQAVAMSNNDDMEIDIESFCGPRGTKKNACNRKQEGTKANIVGQRRRRESNDRGSIS